MFLPWVLESVSILLQPQISPEPGDCERAHAASYTIVDQPPGKVHRDNCSADSVSHQSGRAIRAAICLKHCRTRPRPPSSWRPFTSHSDATVPSTKDEADPGA